MRDSDKIRMLIREAFLDERTLFKNFKHLDKSSSSGLGDSKSGEVVGWSSHPIFDKSKINKIEGLKKQIASLLEKYGAKKEDIVKYNEEFDKLAKDASGDLNISGKISQQKEKQLTEFSKKIKNYFKTLIPQIFQNKFIVDWYKLPK
jgi:hypothetical protein